MEGVQTFDSSEVIGGQRHALANSSSVDESNDDVESIASSSSLNQFGNIGSYNDVAGTYAFVYLDQSDVLVDADKDTSIFEFGMDNVQSSPELTISLNDGENTYSDTVADNMTVAADSGDWSDDSFDWNSINQMDFEFLFRKDAIDAGIEPDPDDNGSFITLTNASAVLEPSTLALLSIALVGLLGRRGKRQI